MTPTPLSISHIPAYILIATAVIISPVQALDLKNAEKLVLSTGYQQKALAADKKALEKQRKGLFAGFLPSASTSLQRPKAAFSNLKIHWLPLKYNAEIELNEEKQDLVELNDSEAKANTLGKLRKLYFNTQLLAAQKAQTQQQLLAAKKVLTLAQKRYSKGIAPQLIMERAILEVKKQEQELSLLGQQEKGQLELLSSSSGVKVLSLSTPLPKNFDFNQLSEKGIGFATTKQNITLNIAKANLALEQSKWWPSLFIDFRYDWFELNPQWSVGINWELSPWNYYSSSSQQASLDAERARLNEAERQEYLERKRIKRELQLMQSRLKSQDLLRKAYAKLSKASLKAYERGLLSWIDYDRDLRLWIAEEDKLLKLRYETVLLWTQWSKLLADKEIFHKALKL